MLNTKAVSAAALVVLASSASSLAQVPAVVNPGFETPRSASGAGLYRIFGWNTFAVSLVESTRRRFVGDAPPAPATLAQPLIRSGTASGEIIPSTRDFVGASTDVFNSSTFFYNDPAYQLGCGDVTFCYWYAIPAEFPMTVQQLGIKMEFKRPNDSIFDRFERFFFGPTTNGTGHTNGQWQQVCTTVTQADWDWIFSFFNTDNPGNPWPGDLPNRVTLLPFRFGGLNGATETNTTFIDDISYLQDVAGTQTQQFELWDDTRVRVNALNQAGVVEPAIPVFVTRLPTHPTPVRYGKGCVPRTGEFTAININDEVASAPGSFPQIWADLIANGYVRPTVQRADGTSGNFGTSVVSNPGFRESGQPLRIVPTMSRADLIATFNVPDDRDLPNGIIGTPERADPLSIQGTGAYTGRANVVTTRTYPDPVNGMTEFIIESSFTTTNNITLDPGPTGRGFDAFRLVWFSSMLSNLAGGVYDGRYLGVQDVAGVNRIIELNDTPRNTHLFPAGPRPTAVGRKFKLFQDNLATFNPGSASIEVTIESVTVGGVAQTTGFGVQGFLAGTTDPNDDSLSIWLEWTGAPATINAGTQIVSRFRVKATDPTTLGDVDTDGDRDCNDLTALVALCGTAEAAANFNAFADMNADGVINQSDRDLLAAVTGSCPGVGACAAPPCPGDADGNRTVNFSDITSVLANFGTSYAPSTGPGDADLNGVVNFTDITTVLANFGTNCP